MHTIYAVGVTTHLHIYTTTVIGLLGSIACPPAHFLLRISGCSFFSAKLVERQLNERGPFRGICTTLLRPITTHQHTSINAHNRVGRVCKLRLQVSLHQQRYTHTHTETHLLTYTHSHRHRHTQAIHRNSFYTIYYETQSWILVSPSNFNLEQRWPPL